MHDVNSAITAIASIATVAAFILALITYLNFFPRAVSLEIYLLEPDSDAPPSIVVRVVNKSTSPFQIKAAYFGVGDEEFSNPIELLEDGTVAKIVEGALLENRVVSPGGSISGIVLKNLSPIQASRSSINGDAVTSRKDDIEDLGDPDDDTNARYVVIETTRGNKRKKLDSRLVDEIPQETNEEFLDRAKR